MSKASVFLNLNIEKMMTTHLIGIALGLIAFLSFGRGIVARSKGKAFQPLPTFLLLLAAFAYQLLYPEVSFWLRLPHALLDIGLGMAIAAGYLWLKKENAKLFFVPGMLGIILGGGLYGASFAFHHLTKSDPWSEGEVTELLVELGEDDQLHEIQFILDKFSATTERAFPEVSFEEDGDLAQYYVVFVCETKAEHLLRELEADTENVDQVAPNHHYDYDWPEAVAEYPETGLGYLANDPLYDQQWYAQALNYEAVYKLLMDRQPKKKAKVAIVDTGVDPNHEDLKRIYQRSGTDGDYDKHAHGTHCAGLAGAVANNGRGIGSMNWEGRYVTISGYAALDDYGRGTDRRVSRAIIQAAEDGADVISMSLGGPTFGGRAPKAQRDAIRYAQKLGAIVVVAAGNSNQDAKNFAPANVDGVICVSAVDPALRKAGFSNTNTSLKRPIASPGVNIVSSTPGSEYKFFNGTSMATPIVSGLVGLMRAYEPKLTTAQAYELLHRTGADGEDAAKVGRLIQPLAVMQALLKVEPVPAQ